MKEVNVIGVWAVRLSYLHDRLRQMLRLWIGRRIVISTANEVVIGEVYRREALLSVRKLTGMIQSRAEAVTTKVAIVDN